MKSALKFPVNVSLSEQLLLFRVESNTNILKQWKYMARSMHILCRIFQQ
jgi:hypothetical protein